MEQVLKIAKENSPKDFYDIQDYFYSSISKVCMDSYQKGQIGVYFRLPELVLKDICNWEFGLYNATQNTPVHGSQWIHSNQFGNFSELFFKNNNDYLCACDSKMKSGDNIKLICVKLHKNEELTLETLQKQQQKLQEQISELTQVVKENIVL